MANCKRCHKPVTVGEVYHPDCIREELETLTGTLCRSYCHFAQVIPSQTMLEEEYCKTCPLMKLLERVE